MSDQHKVTVELGERAYEIIIGSGVLARAATHIAPLLPRPRLAIVADANLADNHLPVLRAALTDAGIAHDSYLVPPGEARRISTGWPIYAIGSWRKKLSAMIALLLWAAGHW